MKTKTRKPRKTRGGGLFNLFGLLGPESPVSNGNLSQSGNLTQSGNQNGNRKNATVQNLAPAPTVGGGSKRRRIRKRKTQRKS
jgi:hypothetical protein